MRGVTRYSQPIRGTRAVHGLTTRLDWTDGILGISQWEGDAITEVDRVLLSKAQVEAMLRFIDEQKKKPALPKKQIWIRR